MRKPLFNYIILIVLLVWSISNCLYAQMDALHGDQYYSASGLHSGNQIRTTFWNDGQIGRRRASLEDIGGEWPINTGRTYTAKISNFFGAEVRGTDGMLKRIVSEANGTRTASTSASSGDYDKDTGEWWTLTPLPGFHNPSPPAEKSSKPRVAMNHWEWSWPELWPDRMDDAVDPGWPGSWNGYFGKNQMNADQESYYVVDDYNNREFKFYPDSTDTLRRGLGLRVSVRGFQWSNVLVEDNIFWLFDVQNVGTHSHDKIGFGTLVAPTVGDVGNNDYDTSDDGGQFSLEEDFGWSYDGDNLGHAGWSPVGYMGMTFFETPGNPYDGIDNDGDGKDGTGPTITAQMFEPKTVNIGDPIILIDYKTFERTVSTMPAQGITITYLDKEITIMPGELVEVQHNLIDDNLNGLIDENNGSVFGEGAGAVHRYLFEGLKYIDYFTGGGSDNLLIEEKRDNGIDEDGDWDIRFDDVGLDGAPNTYDPGEGDGLPTSGAGTEFPGEPHIDKTDIDESDMIGLTSFNIFTPWDMYPLQEDELLWGAIEPGYLNALGQIGETDIILGSGYFPMKPDQIERFSLGYIMGYEDEIFRNRQWAEKAYHENYNFSKAPYIPTVNAVPGDRKITLYWDDFAEESFDPLTGYDFEGYCIYRSTSPDWSDMTPITDGYGSVKYRVPIKQFDLKNNIFGFAQKDVQGVHFYLGDDTGLVHSWTDTTVKNGLTYYYAVTSFDHGSDSLGISPTECSKYISISTTTGEVDKGKNVVVVCPAAPSVGFMDANVESEWIEGSTTDGSIGVSIIDPNIMENRRYRVTFEDTSLKKGMWQYAKTTNFSLVDITNSGSPDTIIDKSTELDGSGIWPMINGFLFNIANTEDLDLNKDLTGWQREGIFNVKVQPVMEFIGLNRLYGIPKSSDYRIEIGEVGIGTSTELFDYPSIPVNFKVINVSLNKEIAFALRERDGDDGKFTLSKISDKIIFLEENEEDSLIVTWEVSLLKASASDTITGNPQSGDVLDIKIYKPFLSHDVYEFRTIPPIVDIEEAKNDMDKIEVVPNPYIVSNSFEPLNPYTKGRGPRALHFTHLPPKCTIKIFNIRGQLIRTLEHDEPAWNGIEVWDMLSKDMLDIAYGVYIYYVEAEGIGQKIGKFAVIK